MRLNLHLYLEFLAGVFDSEEEQMANYERYVTKMELADTWGDGVCLQAAADKFRVSVRVIRADAAENLIVPREKWSERVLVICYLRDEQHYDSAFHIHDEGVTGCAAAQVDTKQHVDNPGMNLSAGA